MFKACLYCNINDYIIIVGTKYLSFRLLAYLNLLDYPHCTNSFHICFSSMRSFASSGWLPAVSNMRLQPYHKSVGELFNVIGDVRLFFVYIIAKQELDV